MTKNPYDVLGVSPNASDDEIKRVYRDLTRKYHPDANVNNPLADLAEEKFKEVQEAYDIIMRERANGGNSCGNNYRYVLLKGILMEISLMEISLMEIRTALLAMERWIPNCRQLRTILTADVIERQSIHWIRFSREVRCGII